MVGRAIGLMNASWRVLWAEQSLVLLAVGPVVTFAAVILLEALIAAAAPTAAVALLVPAAVFVVCASMFWSAAIVAGANEAAEGRPPTVAGSLRIAARHTPALCAWAFYSVTVGIGIRVAGRLLGRLGIVGAWAGELAFSVATMLVLPAIVIDGAGSIDARRHARALLDETWRTRLAGQFGFDIVAALVASPTLVLVVVAALLDIDALMSAALLACAGSFIAAGLVTSACLSVYRVMLYRYVTGRSVPQLYGTQAFTRDLATA